MISNIINQNCYLLGHRGARAEKLENSALGFVHAQNLKHHHRLLDGVEFDIQMTADGKFVVVHDDTLVRLANQQSKIANLTLYELQKVSQSDYRRYLQQFDNNFLAQQILALENLLPLLNGYQHIELEIKTHTGTDAQILVENLLRLLSDSPWQSLPITLTSFDTQILAQLQILKPKYHCNFATGLLLEPKTTLPSQIAFFPMPTPQGKQLIYTTFNLACRLGCVQVGIYYALITPTLVAAAQRFGLKVTAWTVNEITTAKNLVDMGVNCVITDYPTLFLQNF